MSEARRVVITPDERLGIARAFQNGKSFEEIRTMFSVSNTSIRRILDEQKISYVKRRRYWTDDEKKRLERYCKIGWDIPAIAKQLDRTESSVYAYIVNHVGLRDSGVALPTHSKRSWTTAEAAKCKELVEQGMSTNKIAEQLGRTPGSVSGWISDNVKNTVHSRAKAARRLDGTPMLETKKEETPVKPSLAEQIETAKAKMAEENDFAIEELHRKTITGKMACYTIENNLFDFHIITPVHTKEEFGALVDEMAKVYALM